MSERNILIVGGAGYIGGALTDNFRLTSPHRITVYDNLLYEDSYRKPVEFIYGDVRDRTLLKSILPNYDCVIWLAAIVGDQACALNPDLAIEVNQESIHWLAENYDGRIIFTSSCSVYGARDGLLTEESPTNPLSVYAQTKLEAEGYLNGKNALILRLGTLYGVSDTYSRLRLDLVANLLTLHAATRGRLTVYGGEQYRPLLHVKDAAAEIVHQVAGNETGIYNLASDNVKIIDIAQRIKEQFPSLVIDQTDMPFEDMRNYQVDFRKAWRELYFEPTYSLIDGIQSIRELIVERRVKDWNNPRYRNVSFLEINHTT